MLLFVCLSVSLLFSCTALCTRTPCKEIKDNVRACCCPSLIRPEQLTVWRWRNNSVLRNDVVWRPTAAPSLRILPHSYHSTAPFMSEALCPNIWAALARLTPPALTALILCRASAEGLHSLCITIATWFSSHSATPHLIPHLSPFPSSCWCLEHTFDYFATNLKLHLY